MTNQPKRIEAELRAAGAKVIRRLELVVYQSLTSATPVDTGFARGSLTPAIGSPIVEAFDRPSDDEAARQQATSAFAANRAKALQIAATYTIQQGRVFLTYRAGYVVFLNEGSSSQAPQKFVERAIASAVRAVASIPL